MEVDMKRAKTARRAEVRNIGSRTRRDGAIDFALRAEELGQAAQGAPDHTYRVIELVGTSERSISDAINSAIERAHKTLRNLRWFEVAKTSGHIEHGKVRHYQVTLKVGFTMEDPR
jgi:flavin-binding protein dodecin